jgi:hypothetical protein
VDALGPEVALKLAAWFSETALCYGSTESASSKKLGRLVRESIRLVHVNDDDILIASRKLAEQVADKRWTVILAIGDCALLHSILALKKAGLAFHGTRVLAIIDSNADTRFERPATAANLLLGTVLHQEALRELDHVVDIGQGSDDDLALVMSLLERPVGIGDWQAAEDGVVECKWAILGPHAPEHLNEILDATDATDIGVIGEENCRAVDTRGDRGRFDLIPRWNRDATLRYLVSEKRIAVIPPENCLERLDCMLLQIPVTIDFKRWQILNAPSIHSAVEMLTGVTSRMAAEKIAWRSTQASRIRVGLDWFRKTIANIKSGLAGYNYYGEAIELDWDCADRFVEMPRLARGRPAAIAALAKIPADIVIAGIRAKEGPAGDLLVEPIVPTLCPDLFISQAQGCVFILRKWVRQHFGSDAQGLMDAISHGASSIAVPIAAAELPNEEATELRSRLMRKSAQATASMSAVLSSQLVQQLLQSENPETSFQPPGHAALLHQMTTRKGIDHALDMVMSEQAKRPAELQRPIELGKTLHLGTRGSESIPVQLYGHCFLAAVLNKPLKRTVSFLLVIKDPESEAADRTYKADVTAGSTDVVIFFHPVAGQRIVTLAFDSSETSEPKEIALLAPTLHTPLSLQTSGRKFQIAPSRPGKEVARRVVGHPGG